MNLEENAKQLHDCATRGETLTTEEQSLLQAWYDQQDQAELQQLGLTAPVAEDATLPNQIPNQIKATIEQIAVTAAQIQTLTTQNEALRRENQLLRRQFAEPPVLQHA